MEKNWHKVNHSQPLDLGNFNGEPILSQNVPNSATDYSQLQIFDLGCHCCWNIAQYAMSNVQCALQCTFYVLTWNMKNEKSWDVSIQAEMIFLRWISVCLCLEKGERINVKCSRAFFSLHFCKMVGRQWGLREKEVGEWYEKGVVEGAKRIK